ncbi:MAG TPA: hypothetical protein VKH17_10260 [Acidimicrobiia bacterium]|nr:hypothetical protein [Acidimicrobiia bacterium]
MSVTRVRVATVIMSCLVAAIVIGACSSSDGSGDRGSAKAKAEAQQFLNQLSTAIRQGNIDFRVARLNPAVIERYGEQQCRDFLSAQPPDNTRRDRVTRVGKPEAFEYDTDTLSVTVPDAIPVHVRETRMGKKADRNLHLARVNGELTYFVDCGAPLVRQ